MPFFYLITSLRTASGLSCRHPQVDRKFIYWASRISCYFK